jgi:hypothetical protein
LAGFTACGRKIRWSRAIAAALVFLEACGIDAIRLPEDGTFNLMIKIALHEAGRDDLAEYFRLQLSRGK